MSRTRRHGRNALLITALMVILGVCLPVAFMTRPAAASVLNDESLIILELRLGKLMLAEGILAYRVDDQVLLPLGATTALLEFAVDVDPRAGRASGWFQDVDRVFSLDVGAGRVVVGGEARAVPPGTAIAADDDIYIEAGVLSDWFPIDIDVRTGQLLAIMTGREDLPVERRLRREAARDEAIAKKRNLIAFPVQEAEYSVFTWPVLDLSAEYRGRGDDITPRVSLQSAGDLATLSTHFFAAHEDAERIVDVARFSAGRTDPAGELLGPLQATEFEFGDLYAPSTPHVLRGKLGRGLALDNRALKHPDRFDATEIDGDGTPGWDVELYVNNSLLDFGTVDEYGRYLFKDVPLGFGRNEFRTILYGPQGQTREQVRVVTVGGEMIPPGQVSWRLFTVQDDRFLIVGDEQLADTPDRGRWTTHAEAGLGVSRRLSLLAAWTHLSLDGVDHTYRSLTTQTVWRGLHLQGTYVDNTGGGSAVSLAGQGQLFGRSLNFDHALFRNFVSDANTSDQQRTRDTRIRFGGNARWGRRPLSYDLKLQSAAFMNRGILRQDLVELRAATALRRIQVSTKVGYRHSVSALDGYSQLTTDQIASGYWGPVLLRGSLRTRIQPEAGLESVAASAAWNPAPRLRLGARIQKNLGDFATTTIGGSLALLMDSYQLTFNTHDTDEQTTFYSLAITTSFTKVPHRPSLHVQRQRMTDGYGATARVFLDRNANGMFDGQDDPLSGVRLAGTGAGRDVITDANGQAYIGGLPAHRERNITLDLETLEDPYLLPIVPGRTATGHPGGHVTLEFPVTYSGDVEGTLYVQTPTGRLPLRGLQLELVDLTQRTIRTAVSEFDGYYLFQEVPPGWYEVHIKEDGLTRRRLRKPAPVAVAVPADGGVADGNDFILHFVNERQVGR